MALLTDSELLAISVHGDKAAKLTYLKGDGMPVEPEGYSDMAADHPSKVGYDASKATSDAQIAAIQALVDAE
jgi:hypothetical protein